MRESDEQIAPPTRPCESCPYRIDVPSGIWDAAEYEKLRRYDRPTAEQPPMVFLCHLTEASPRICAGWAGCHDGDDLLALRIAVTAGTISPETAQRVVDYTSAVPLFPSGAAAAEHGERDTANPSAAAERMMDKIERSRRAAASAPGEL